MLLCSKSWLEPGNYWLAVVVTLCLQCLLFYFPSQSGRIDGVAVFIPAMSAQHTHTLSHIHTVSLSLFLFLCLSPPPSREVNIFCRKADGELVLTTSRSASQSLQSSRQPRYVPVASVYVSKCACVLLTVWHLHGRFIPHHAPSIIQ